ncbi:MULTISPECIES: SRPBCC family protein [unclassified Streptomyces]|uniref:SRPBCC family protein n=1 Tax=unclassified Streptomyces TaxID=2593676 RepID=UPI0036C33925
MAVRHRVIGRSREAVWTVLENPRLYGDWVTGVASTRPIDEQWPAVGTALAYTIAVGRWSYEGYTVVRRHEPPDWLELEAHSGRLGTARVSIELRTWGEQTLIIVDEHPLRGFGGTVHVAPLEVFIQLRHRNLLANLARTVERTTPAAAGVAGATAAA